MIQVLYDPRTATEHLSCNAPPVREIQEPERTKPFTFQLSISSWRAIDTALRRNINFIKERRATDAAKGWPTAHWDKEIRASEVALIETDLEAILELEGT